MYTVSYFGKKELQWGEVLRFEDRKEYGYDFFERIVLVDESGNIAYPEAELFDFLCKKEDSKEDFFVRVDKKIGENTYSVLPIGIHED